MSDGLCGVAVSVLVGCVFVVGVTLDKVGLERKREKRARVCLCVCVGGDD